MRGGAALFDSALGSGMQVHEPWHSVTNADESKGLEEELRREVRRGHELYGAAVRAVARRLECDDVLFSIEDGSGRVAVVHLTWSPRERPPWPDTDIYADLATWMVERMNRDRDSYMQ